MARFAIDARVITNERDGVGRYGRELIPALAAAAPSDTFLVLRHPSNRDSIVEQRNVREVFLDGRLGHLFDHYLSDHTRLRAVFESDGWPDLYHAPFQMLPRIFPAAAPQSSPAMVATLHDLIWLDYPFAHGPALAGISCWLTARTAIVGSLRRAHHIIAGSAAAAAGAARWLRHDRVTVVHHGVGAAFRESPPPIPDSLAALDRSRPWIAAVGNHKRYKNLEVLLRALAIARRRGTDASLILIGRCEPLAGKARALGVADAVLLPGEVGDEALRAVVGRAALFVHPAFVEGFGMPVVEAMALGIPTAVADVPVLREVGGDGVLRFDPHDAEALAVIIEHVLKSPETGREWAVRARTRSQAFDWSVCARQTLDVYRRAIESRQVLAPTRG